MPAAVRLRRGATGRLQRPQPIQRRILDRAAAFGQHRPGGVVGIELVGLTGPPAGRTGRPLHLVHGDPRGGQGAADPGAVAGGAFDSDPDHLTAGGEEGHRPPVPGAGGGELGVSDHLPHRGHRGDVNGVGVWIYPTDNLDSCCHHGNHLSMLN